MRAPQSSKPAYQLVPNTQAGKVDLGFLGCCFGADLQILEARAVRQLLEVVVRDRQPVERPELAEALRQAVRRAAKRFASITAYSCKPASILAYSCNPCGFYSCKSQWRVPPSAVS